jgi:hypothetical protein
VIADGRLGPVVEINFFSKGPNRVGVSLRSPEDGNRYSVRNVVLSGLLQFRTIHRALKSGDSECYPPFRTLQIPDIFFNLFPFVTLLPFTPLVLIILQILITETTASVV